MAPPPSRRIAYGDHPDQCGDLHLPPGDGPWPAVILIHGGFWKVPWDRALMTPPAGDLAARGIAAWNIEYRRLGQEGGGWPGTFDDVAAAADAVLELDDIDSTRVATVGHSAGGHLALWLAARGRIAPGQPGASPRLHPRAAVSLAGVADLARGAADNLDDGACAALLGGRPGEVPERYAAASPIELLPLGTPVLLVHGAADDIVPPEQSRAFARAATAAGDEVDLVELASADHFDVIESTHAAWAVVGDRLARLLT